MRSECLVGPADGLLYTPGSVWKAQVRIGSGRRGIMVPRGSRVGEVLKSEIIRLARV